MRMTCLMIVFAVTVMISLIIGGCASGQQGQGETRAVQSAVYIENYTGSQPGPAEPLLAGVLNGNDAHNEQTMTLQPRAEGTASANNQPTVSPNIPINVTPGAGGLTVPSP